MTSSIDCGNTQTLLSDISSNGNPAQVRNQILHCAPVVSNTVLISYLENPSFPPGQKFQILLACSPLDPIVLNAVANSTLPTGMKSVLQFISRFGTSPFLAVENTIAELQSDASYMLSDLIRLYLNDTITQGARDSALKYIKLSGVYNGSSAGTYPGKLLRTALAQGDSAGAALQYDTLVMQEGNSSNAQIHQVLLQLYKTNVNAVASTNPGLVTQLNQIASDTMSHESRLLALWLLQQLQPVVYNPEYQVLTASSGNRVMNTETEAVAASLESPFKLSNYPNPFGQITDIQANIPEGVGEAVLVVTDILGREAARYVLQEGNNLVKFSSTPGSGEFICNLYLGDKKVESRKMIQSGN